MSPIAAPSIDLRSDTVTQPSPEMRAVMAKASVGDDVFGEDPSINDLEATSAQLFGMEAGLFVPSGTMANQIAIQVYCRPGDGVICGDGAHSLLYEGGGAAAFSGVQLRPTPSPIFEPQEAERCYSDDNNTHNCPTSLIMIEHTHNRAGGLPWRKNQLTAIHAFCQEKGVPLHMDGARLFNALAATGQTANFVGTTVDSLSFCLSKGLGCPVGSVMVGSHAFIKQARRARKRFGGGLRQGGFLAAAGLFALENNRVRLADDHSNAATLASGWADIPGIKVTSPPITNLLYIEVEGSKDAHEVVSALGKLGVKVLALDHHQIRAVCHMDVSRKDIQRAIEALSQVMAA